MLLKSVSSDTKWRKSPQILYMSMELEKPYSAFSCTDVNGDQEQQNNTSGTICQEMMEAGVFLVSCRNIPVNVLKFV